MRLQGPARSSVVFSSTSGTHATDQPWHPSETEAELVTNEDKGNPAKSMLARLQKAAEDPKAAHTGKVCREYMSVVTRFLESDKVGDLICAECPIEDGQEPKVGDSEYHFNRHLGSHRAKDAARELKEKALQKDGSFLCPFAGDHDRKMKTSGFATFKDLLRHVQRCSEDKLDPSLRHHAKPTRRKKCGRDPSTTVQTSEFEVGMDEDDPPQPEDDESADDIDYQLSAPPSRALRPRAVKILEKEKEGAYIFDNGGKERPSGDDDNYEEEMEPADSGSDNECDSDSPPPRKRRLASIASSSRTRLRSAKRL